MNIYYRFLFIFILSFAGIFLCSGIIRNQLKKFRTHTTERLTEILYNDTDYDILFIGSSRTHTSINPKIVDSVVNCSSYNAGVEGGNLLEFKMTFDAYLINHPPPKYLVLTLDLYSFNLQRPFFNYTNYLDFLDNKIIDSTLCVNDHNTTLFKILPFAKIAEYDDFSKGNALKALINKENEIKAGEFQYKGYLSNSIIGIIENNIQLPQKVNYAISKTSLKYLKDIITTCKSNNIFLFFTYAPEYKFKLQNNITNKSQIFNEIKNISNVNKILFFRDDSLSICNDSTLFANVGHLNTLGATKYSKVLADRFIIIKNHINDLSK